MYGNSIRVGGDDPIATRIVPRTLYPVFLLQNGGLCTSLSPTYLSTYYYYIYITPSLLISLFNNYFTITNVYTSKQYDMAKGVNMFNVLTIIHNK